MAFSSQHNLCEGYLGCMMQTEVEKVEAGTEAGGKNQSKFRSMENGLEDCWKGACCKPGNCLRLSSPLVFKRVQMLINCQQRQTYAVTQLFHNFLFYLVQKKPIQLFFLVRKVTMVLEIKYIAKKICCELVPTYNNVGQIVDVLHINQRPLYSYYHKQQKKNGIQLNTFVRTKNAKYLGRLKSTVTKVYSVVVRKLRQRAIWPEVRMSQLTQKYLRIAYFLSSALYNK